MALGSCKGVMAGLYQRSPKPMIILLKKYSLNYLRNSTMSDGTCPTCLKATDAGLMVQDLVFPSLA